MEWVKRHDPVFGAGSYGHISRLIPEHLFLMHKQFERLKDGGWKNDDSFSGFIDAVEGVSEMGEVGKAGKEFFQKLPTVFLDKFEATFKEYTKKWRDHKTLPIVIAGQPRIARAFIRWLFDRPNATANEEVEMIHHYTGLDTPKIKVEECINWLTEQISEEQKEAMQYDTLISDLMDELTQFANCEDDTVDMLDKSTWEGKPFNFERAENLIWNAIAPRAAHQQRVENLVQTAGHLGKTNVEEARRSARAKIHSLFYRDFSRYALSTARQADITSTNIIPRRLRVEGAQRLIMKAKFTDSLLDKMDVAVKSLEEADPTIMSTIVSDMYLRNKSSALANEEKYKKFEEASNANTPRILHSRNLVDVTSLMDGSVMLSYLSDKAGAREYVLAELAFRNIPYYNEKPVHQMTKTEKKRHDTGLWKEQTMTWMKKALKIHEHDRLCAELRREMLEMNVDLPLPKLNEVANIVPLSDKMKEWLPKQWEVYKAKNGQVESGPDDS
jgi:hypothetical protein